ncbi:UNVERIFIED_CONTAM: Pentatricopeptide repeat-containing protein [Sesamum radiatum]|uniref:Pentatricopeptide repeat-containing protein n=1 Tax=Sesamum radiatum TaxID=300843 RepID=A0AAW2W7C1_SESRA
MAARRSFLHCKKFARPTRSFSTNSPVNHLSSSAQTVSSASFLLEKILWALKRGQSINTHLFYQLNPSTYAQVLCECRDDLHIGQKFIDLIALNYPNFKHSSWSLSAAVHVSEE